MFGLELYPTVYDKAAAYLYHIVCNHPFNDGNKRTGFGAAILSAIPARKIVNC
jgi:death-on-curing protein